MPSKLKTYYHVCLSADGHPYVVGKYPIDPTEKTTKTQPKRIGFLRRLISGGEKCQLKK